MNILDELDNFINQTCIVKRNNKWLFKFFADGQIFDFPKLFQYGILPQLPRRLLYHSR
jgi:hypothetical protein